MLRDPDIGPTIGFRKEIGLEAAYDQGLQDKYVILVAFLENNLELLSGLGQIAGIAVLEDVFGAVALGGLAAIWE